MTHPLLTLLDELAALEKRATPGREVKRWPRRVLVTYQGVTYPIGDALLYAPGDARIYQLVPVKRKKAKPAARRKTRRAPRRGPKAPAG